ncbi:MAG: DEAD/DEAH box helicase [Bacteroidales bacterium]|nr:DEAD/DEAH box helicase [Bacteroidales bacterium]
MSEKIILALIVQKRTNPQMGYMVVPYFIETTDGRPYQLLEVANQKSLKKEEYKDCVEKSYHSIVNTLDKVSDVAIAKRFFGGDMVKMRKFEIASNKQTYEYIRAYIDEAITKVMQSAVSCNMPIYKRRDGYTSLYPEDQLSINPYLSKPRISFYLEEDKTLKYRLSVIEGDNSFYITGERLSVVSERPAIFILNNRVYRMRDVDYPMMRAFEKFRCMTIDASKVEAYMRTFVAKCIIKYRVEVKGFALKKADNSNCKAIINLIEDVMGYCFQLTFAYGDKIYGYRSFQKKVDLAKEGDKYTMLITQRNEDYEEYIYNMLISNGLRCRTDSILELDLEDDVDSRSMGACVCWINNNATQLKNLGITVKNNVDKGETLYLENVDLEVKLDEKVDWFDVYAVVHFEGFNIPFLKFRNHIVNRVEKYTLPNGSVFYIPQEWFSTWGDIMANLPVVKEGEDSFQMPRTLRTLLRPILIMTEDTDEGGKAGEITEVSHIERQGVIKATLRTYQEEGFQWLANLCQSSAGGILADDMGLGKTLQTISVINHLYATEDVEDGHLPSLIIVPVSLISNWVREVLKFAPHLNIVQWTQIKENTVGPTLFKYDIIIVSYRRALSDAKLLSQMQFRMMVVDESQYIKNPHSQTYKAIASFKALHKLLLTGTPIENRLSDLWAQMNIANPHLLGSEAAFHINYELPIVRYANRERSDKLQSLIAPYMLRRTKDRVAKDLPPLTEQIVYCAMTEEQSVIYESEKSSSRNELMIASMNFGVVEKEKREKDVVEEGEEEQAMGMASTPLLILQALTRLRMIAIDPQMVSEYEDVIGKSGKMNVVMEHLQSAIEEGHKVLIFSSFVRDLNILASSLRDKSIGYSILTGETRDRDEQISRFNDDPRTNVFLLSMKAGGTGLNLTEADYVFILNPWWNPAVEAQAYARAHRIGQQKPVFVYRFISQDTVEEKIVRLQNAKKDLAQAFEATDNPFEVFGMEELRQLIIE